MDLGIQHIFRETFLSSIAISKQALVILGSKKADADHIADLFQRHDRELIVEQHAVQHDENRLIQSARETARELETLLQRDLDK